MSDKLIIVESPAKANTIKKFLGGSTKVVASMGHIRDLPKSKLGVDTKTFEPQYINIRGKGDLIKSLKKEAKAAKKVYIATDPDREGEAIAWHLSNILDVDKSKMCRVTFNEITKDAVKKAIQNPRDIDMDLTDAQQARRVLDRIVGYKISPVLWKKVQKGLSAGRVQSVAVKLIVDREEEIEKFIPEEYWNIYATLSTKKPKKSFEAKFFGKDNKKLEGDGASEAEKNRFNSKFEILQGEKLNTDTTLKMIDTIKNNLIGMEVVNGREIRLNIDKNNSNEETVSKLHAFMEENKNYNYDAKTEYDDNGFVKSILLTINVER